MEQMQIQQLLQAQKAFFETGATLPASYRIQALKKLKQAILQNISKIEQALKADLGKSNFEGYMCEIGMTLSELTYLIRHTKSFAKDKKVHTPMAQFASKSYVKSTPYGNVLIMSPWNYPLLLTLEPLADAIAAGNTAIVKPSAYSPATTQVIAEIIAEIYPKEYVAVVTGGRAENQYLLEQKFDYIFFTGSKSVGKLVMEKASAHLTPITLELGGKSPCIIHPSANLKIAAKRVVFGKYLNLGQTCVAPDYVLCHSSVKDRFIEYVKQEITAQFGENPLQNPNYGKIVNQKHFERILGLIDSEKTVHGGNANAKSLQIEPTVMDGVTVNDAVMQEEIFGPVMPVLTYDKIEDVISYVNGNEKPLALYLFAEDKKIIQKVTETCQFGGGCVNDTIIHLATAEMGFGGVGESGMGAYHGKYGFDTFSHKKSIVDKKTCIDLPMRYQPYTKGNLKLLKMFLK